MPATLGRHITQRANASVLRDAQSAGAPLAWAELTVASQNSSEGGMPDVASARADRGLIVLAIAAAPAPIVVAQFPPGSRWRSCRSRWRTTRNLSVC